MLDKFDDHRPRPRLSVADLIPASRLASIGDFDASEPAVCDGDDVYELNLTGDDLDVEYAFLRCVVDADDANKIEDLITYAGKNYWLGGKNIYINLDVGKTILNRQTKLVLHNSKPQNSVNNNTSIKLLKKTDFKLEEWPFVSQNQPLIIKGNDECELAPWMRSRNKRFSPSNSKKTIEVAKSAPGTPMEQHEHWKALRHRRSQLLLLRAGRGGGNLFSPRPSLIRPVFATVPTVSKLAWPQQKPQRWPGNLYQQPRFPTPLPPPPLSNNYCHYWNRPIDTVTPAAATKLVNYKDKNTMLQSSRLFDNLEFAPENNVKDLVLSSENCSNYSTVNSVNDKCIEKIMSTFETNNKDALRSFLCLLKRVYPKRLEQFDKIMTTMDYLNSQPPILVNTEHRNVSSDQ